MSAIIVIVIFYIYVKNNRLVLFFSGPFFIDAILSAPAVFGITTTAEISHASAIKERYKKGLSSYKVLISKSVFSII
jgi:hypothetical protein